MDQIREIAQPASALRGKLRGTGIKLDEISAIQGHMDQEVSHHQLALLGRRSNDVAMWHRSVDMGGIAVHYVDYQCNALAATVVIDQPQDGIMLKLPLSGSTRVSIGPHDYMVRPNEFTVIRHGVRYRSTMAGDSCHLAVTISSDWLQNYLSTQDLHLRSSDLSFAPVSYDIDREGVLLSGVLNSVILGLARGDGVLNTPAVLTHLKELITSAVLSLSPEYRQADQRRISGLTDEAPAYVHRAEQFMRDHLGTPIEIADIVRGSGATKRTLHAGFRKHRGTTPMAYLKRLRLSAAKAALEQAEPGRNAVTEVATAHGFFHLGRFSSDFKAAYGLLPSELLNRHR